MGLFRLEQYSHIRSRRLDLGPERLHKSPTAVSLLPCGWGGNRVKNIQNQVMVVFWLRGAFSRSHNFPETKNQNRTRAKIRGKFVEEIRLA